MRLYTAAMSSLPESIFLDTNIFIFAALDPDSDENKILSVLQKDRNPQQMIRAEAIAITMYQYASTLDIEE